MKSIFILLAVIAAAGCVSEQNIQPNDETQEQAVELENQTGIVEEENQTDTQPVNTVRLDCGNEIGNGDQIVSGPQSPGEGDRDNPFRSLTVNPSSPNVILVGTERNGFVRSSDGGNTWERFRYGVRHETEGYTEIYDIGIAANSPNVIYAATTLGGPGPLGGSYPSSGGGVYKSSDGGMTWERKNCGIHNNGGRTTAIHVSDADHVIIGISAGTTSWFSGDVQQNQFFYGGIYGTSDGGESWTKASAPENADISGYTYILQAKSDPSILYTFGLADDPDSSAGFLKSTDSGKTWQPFAADMRSLRITHFDISKDGKTIYAIQDSTDARKIFKSTDWGGSWTNYNLGSSGYTVTVSPVDSNRILLGKKDGLYLSTNGMTTEKKVLDNKNANIEDVVFDPSNSGIVYAIVDGYVMYKSTDAGETFSKVKDIRNEVLNTIS